MSRAMSFASPSWGARSGTVGTVVFYTSAKAPTYPLLLDASLGSVGATISNAMISAGVAGP